MDNTALKHEPLMFPAKDLYTVAAQKFNPITTAENKPDILKGRTPQEFLADKYSGGGRSSGSTISPVTASFLSLGGSSILLHT